MGVRLAKNIEVQLRESSEHKEEFDELAAERVLQAQKGNKIWVILYTLNSPDAKGNPVTNIGEKYVPKSYRSSEFDEIHAPKIMKELDSYMVTLCEEVDLTSYLP